MAFSCHCHHAEMVREQHVVSKSCLKAFSSSIFELRFLNHQFCKLLLRQGSHGADPTRIDRLMATTCRCHRQRCYQKLGSIKQELLEWLRVFWRLPKHIQDEYLKNIMDGASTKHWVLLGQRMSQKCTVASIGCGNSRMQRVASGKPDYRYKVWGCAPGHETCDLISLFLHPVY